MGEKKKIDFDKIEKVSNGAIPILCGLGLALVVLGIFVGFINHIASKSGNGYAKLEDITLTLVAIVIGTLGAVLAYHSAGDKIKEKSIMSWSSSILMVIGFLMSLMLETALPFLMFALSILASILISHGFWMEEVREEIKSEETETELNKADSELKTEEA